ncbi:aminoacyl-tRNA hydrolase [Aureibacter tunicatorum]|uniref:Peptidyl-tRNA hydrolase n=1 Tax=Aureibacter tunicatorum TaxID=866807 RepID=A0AAE4BSD9_9BACT|nr:aminoacyl-tRNA hydrolase [Aureibacter tunicatorum]MDR6238287.1 PTH1 family peptidyl-tRNA hydrolase [Aureibacter tunicatorum]BDD03320.1 peptidyl-tRNA hydrolase [Aureibacter tunicatorum]
MKYLVVGLGNIGPEYDRTRHNIGFMIVDQMAKENNVSFDSDRLAFHCEYKHKGRIIHMIKPTTYMNLSGRSVNHWMKTLKIPKENIIVLVDDLAIPFGKLRLKAKGSSAGHNGLKDIESVTGGQNYARLRFGIGDDYPKGRQADFVLGKFNNNEEAELPLLIDKSIEIIHNFCTIGIERAMNFGNTK